MAAGKKFTWLAKQFMQQQAPKSAIFAAVTTEAGWLLFYC